MKVIRGMLGSKKWSAMLASVIGLAVGDLFGVELSPDVLNAITVIVLATVGGEALADAAGARASRQAEKK